MNYKLSDLQQDVEGLAFQLENGCGNRGCVIKEPIGMVTNGGCKCTPRQIKTKLMNLSAVVERMNNKGAMWNK